MTGAEAERELRKQRREAVRRAGASTAALEADLWFEVLQYCEDIPDDSAVVAEFGAAIEAITGIRTVSKQRTIVSAARKTKGTRLHLATFAGWGDEAERKLSRFTAETIAEDQAYRAVMAKQGAKSAITPREPSLELSIRDAIVMDARGKTAEDRLKNANAALLVEGFDQIGRSTFYDIRKKFRGSAF